VQNHVGVFLFALLFQWTDAYYFVWIDLLFCQIKICLHVTSF
jgi:hypothetical protein